METLSIGQLSAETSVPSSTIRYYEERNLLTPEGRVSGRRQYDPSAVQRLQLIRLCIAAGFSLDECSVLLNDRQGKRQASRDLAHRKLAELDEQVANLMQARALIEHGLACTCPSLENCLCQGAEMLNAAPEAPRGT